MTVLSTTALRQIAPATLLLLAVLASVGSIPATSAAGMNPLPTMRTALSAASSFAVTYTASSTQKPPAIERRTLVLVRHGGTVQVHTLDAMRPSGAGDTTIVEDVASGDTVCERVAFNAPLPLTGTYGCDRNAARAAGLAMLADPLVGLLGDQVLVTFQPAPARMLGGRRCTGYAFTARARSERSAGTVYVAPTGVPCEQVATTLGPAIGPTNGTATATVHSVTVWSHIDDPALAIPAGVVPADATGATVQVLPVAARAPAAVVLRLSWSVVKGRGLSSIGCTR